ncbi:MAG: GntP family permease [Fuerstiella sp.]|nr:GntP family permease [Fuerstiella sp.]
MNILLILIAGLIVVIGSIVFARLPAFLALTLGAILVAGLTPREMVFEAFISQNSGQVGRVDGNSIELSGSVKTDDDVLLIAPGLSDESDSATLISVAKARMANEQLLSAGSTSFDSVTPGDVVVPRRHAQVSVRRASQPALTRVTTAMGEYFGKLAIIIVCASVIGRCLLDSGSAERVVRSVLTLLGQRLAPTALTVSSFILGIPVFFDTVFYLMIPIAKVLRIQTGANYLLYVLAIVAGASMAHSLVPPTPGPLAVAEIFHVELSQMILGGTIVGVVAATAGLLWASMVNRITTLNVPEEDTAILEATAQKDESELPPVWLALLPIGLPVVLISLPALWASLESPVNWVSPRLAQLMNPIVETLSNKNIALLISAGVALTIYLWNVRPSRQTMSEAMQSAIGSAGAILLITCAGGAFGRILFQTNVASLLDELPTMSPIVLVVAAFLVTAGVRTAQGSATVAMMTSAGIFAPLVTSGAVDVAPLYMALAVGCGSKPIAWMNDSGFWIITKMSGMTETQGLKFISPFGTVMGIAGLLAVIAAVILLPNP